MLIFALTNKRFSLYEYCRKNLKNQVNNIVYIGKINLFYMLFLLILH